jgi:hypothetical protein
MDERLSLGSLAGWQPIAHDVGNDQRTVGGIPQEDGVCLRQSNEGCNRCRAGGDKVLLIVLGYKHDLEPTVISLWPSNPINVDSLDSSSLLACSRHDFKYAV